MLLQQTISGPVQSGKTTTAVNLIRQYLSDGVGAVYITQNQERLQHVQKRFGVPCLTIRNALQTGLADYRVIVIDESDYFPKGTVDAVVEMLSSDNRFATLILVKDC